MPSKSKGRKRKKSEQQRQVKEPTRNWLDLPSDLTMNILQRVGVVDILNNVQKVCTAWREICKDPVMWRVVNLDGCYAPKFFGDIGCDKTSWEMRTHVVERSQGQLVDLTLDRLCYYELIEYVADRSSKLKRLEIVYSLSSSFLREAFKKLSLLEELSLVRTWIMREEIEAAGHYCPLLKTLKVNQKPDRWLDFGGADADSIEILNEVPLAIGKNLPDLTQLELIGNNMTNIGLQAILDGCCHLESLDLRQCLFVDLKGALGKRCSQQIKHLKLHHDSLEGYLSKYNILDGPGSDDDNDVTLVYFGV